MAGRNRSDFCRTVGQTYIGRNDNGQSVSGFCRRSRQVSVKNRKKNKKCSLYTHINDVHPICHKKRRLQFHRRNNFLETYRQRSAAHVHGICRKRSEHETAAQERDNGG